MKKRGNISIHRWVFRILIAGFLFILAGLVFDTYYSTRLLEEESEIQLRNILSGQVEIMDSSLDEASGTLLNYQMTNANMTDLMRANTDASVYYAVKAVTSDFSNLLLVSTKAEVAFVVKQVGTLKKKGIAVSSGLSSVEKSSLNQYVDELSVSGMGTDYTWKPVKIDGKWYFLYIIESKTGGYCIGQGLRAERILTLLSMRTDEKSALSIRDGEDGYMLNEEFFRSAEKHKRSLLKSGEGKELIATAYSKSLRCQIVFGVKDVVSERFRKIIGLLEISSLVIFVVYFLVFTNLIRLVVRPLDRLKMRINRISEGDLETPLEITSRIPEELKGVYGTLNEMMSRIQEMKIAQYESELKQKQYQIQFLSMQIEPHFYLNSMKVIYALAQTKQSEVLQSIVLRLSDYFRYLTYDSAGMVPLSAELTHVENYLDIVNAGAARPVIARLMVSPDAEQVHVPKLFVQTFIENSVKYGAPENEELEMAIHVTTFGDEGEKYLQMTVSDNGKGFDEEFIEEIARNGFEDREGHVGLSNLHHRLQFLYPDGQSYMTISNSNGGGAQAEVIIPVTAVNTEEGE